MEGSSVDQGTPKPRMLSSKANRSVPQYKVQISSGPNSPHTLDDRFTQVQQVEDQIAALDKISAAPKFLGGWTHKHKQASSSDKNELQLSGLISEPLSKSGQPSQKSGSTTYLDNMVVISQRSIGDFKNASKKSLQQFGVARVPVVCRSINSQLGRVEVMNQVHSCPNTDEPKEYLSESLSSASED